MRAIPSPISVTMPTSAERIGTSNSLMRCLIRPLISSDLMPNALPYPLAQQFLPQPRELRPHGAVDEMIPDLDRRPSDNGRIGQELDGDLAAQFARQFLLV